MERSSLEKTALLSAGRIFGAVLSLGIPMFLSRFLSLEDYGLYKLMFLLQTGLVFILPLGIDGGLFYFIRCHPEKHAIYGLNVTLSTLILGVSAAVLIYFLSEPLGRSLHQEQFSLYRLPFCLFLCFSVCSNHFQVYLIYLDKLRSTMILEFAGQIYKALAIIGGFYLWHSLAIVLWLLAAFALIQFLLILNFDARKLVKTGVSIRTVLDSWREQVRYALPLGLSNIVLYTMEFDKFLVSALFGAREFALYTVGCFRVPFVGSIDATMLDYMGLGMVEAKQSADMNRFKELWKETLRIIFIYEIPLCLFTMVFAKEVLTLIYSGLYKDSAGILVFFALITLLGSDRPDMIFRSLQETRRLFLMQTGFGLCSLLFTLGGAFAGGLMGVIIGKLLAHFLGLFVKLRVYQGLLDISVRELLDWSNVIRCLGISLVTAAALALIPESTNFTGALRLALLFTGYGLLLSILFWYFGVIHREEKAKILGLLSGFRSYFLGHSRRMTQIQSSDS